MQIPRFLRAVSLTAFVIALAGCGSNRYWTIGPVSKSETYHNKYFPGYATFTCAPLSSLLGDTALAGDAENAMLFSLANNLIFKGFDYTSSIDSADFIVTAWVSDNYNPDDTLDLPAPPQFHDVTPFPLDTAPFGNPENMPQAISSNKDDRVYPELTVLIYEGSGKYHLPNTKSDHDLLMRSVWAAAANDPNPWHAAQFLIERFAAPFHSGYGTSVKFGKGEMGFGFAIRTWDGVNFWPEITFLDKGYPANIARLRKNDAILEVDGQSLKNLDFAQCIALMRGDPGRMMSLKVWRWPDNIFDVNITMAQRGSVR